MNTSQNSDRKVIGVLKLNTTFPRLQGDIGNPASFDYPVQYVTVESALPANITVADELPKTLQTEFINAAKTLIASNVSVLTTTCGFLSTMQRQLAQLSAIPVICSSLELLPLIASIHGGTDRIGVLTFNKNTLNENHTAGIIPGATEGLMPDDHLREVISDDLDSLNEELAFKNVVAASDRLLETTNGISAILLECTNLSPYKQQIKAHTGLAVYDIVDAVNWLLAAQAS